MDRIFLGLCQVGSWGCFNMVNLLEERILSAVSTAPKFFIKRNPGYAMRFSLPDNQKKLYRSMAISHPHRALISQVMLLSYGFQTAETKASKSVTETIVSKLVAEYVPLLNRHIAPMAWWNWKTLVDCISEACKRSPNIASVPHVRAEKDCLLTPGSSETSIVQLP
ncbi:hypothetical protein BY996DRAFT_6422048 [Phakopsora pachyrhizi]|nr:hypothetical protein BY996DRAFT_6422048 [Phakopsora pachyrhizi]